MKVSQNHIRYLEKIVRVCRENGKNVFLIRCPMHANFAGMDNEVVFNEILATRFQGIEFLDFRTVPFSNLEFGDLEHLNYRGSRRFSIWFDELLKTGLLSQKDKQGFIDLKQKNQPTK